MSTNKFGNKIKIEYDPYKKEMVYHIWDKEKRDWYEPTKESDFSKSEYRKNVSLQNKIYDVLAEIDRHYNTDTEPAQILFNGTDDDFKYIKPIIEKHKDPKHSKINLIKGDLYLDSAKDVLPEIAKHYSEVEELLKRSPNKDIEDEIKRYTEAVKPCVSVCVMGLYSSGKSAFINSLIGKEILPSADNPTTAKNYKITLSDKNEISFKCRGEDIKLRFNGEKYQNNKTGELPIIRELLKIVEEGSDAESRMYHALKIINDHKDKTFSDLIEVTVSPCPETALPLNDYTFVIYDTPGSDTANHKEHLEVLKDALQGQTNGLPIFVTSSDNMDREGNTELIEMIKTLGSALDLTNTIVVVNKSDTMSKDGFEEKRQKVGELEVSKLSTRICFVSSIAGLGSKKVVQGSADNWIDENYEQTYEGCKKRFADTEDKFYKQLYTYNMMPKNRLEDYCESESVKFVKNAPGLIHINSGLHFVEDEIGEFARNFAFYNKCASAGKYLKNAVNMTVKQINKKNEELNELSLELRSKMDEKQAALIDALDARCKYLVAAFNTEYTDKMSVLHTKHNSFDGSLEEIKSAWKDVKSNIDRQDEAGRINAMKARVQQMYDAKMKSFESEVSDLNRKFWQNKDAQFRDACLKIVIECDDLSEAQKNTLKNYVRNVYTSLDYDRSVNVHDAFKPRRFLWMKSIHLDAKQCADDYVSQTQKFIDSSFNDILRNKQDQFEQWQEDLRHGIQSQLGKMNPELITLSAELDSRQNERKQLNDQVRFLDNHQNAVQELMKFKERDRIE